MRPLCHFFTYFLTYIPSFKDGTEDRAPLRKKQLSLGSGMMIQWNMLNRHFGTVSFVSNKCQGIKECTGWGYLVWDGDVEHQGSGCLGEQSSVFQTEITAITRVAQFLTHHKSTKTVIFVDSQTALLALDNTEIHSYLVWECTQSLGELGRHNEVVLHWVKLGPCGIWG